MIVERLDLANDGVRAELAALMNACEQREPLFQRPIAADELSSLLTDPGAFQLEGQLWRDASGGAAAFGFLRFFHVNGAINSDLRLFVAPDRWHGDYEAAVLGWAFERVQAVRAEYGGMLWLFSDCLPTGAWRMATLEHYGLKPVRSSYTMERSLQEPVADVGLPGGYTLDTVSAPADLPQWVELFNLAYHGQWNYVPTTVETQAELRQDARYQNRYDLIARDAGGALAAFCLGFALMRGGTKAGWILEIATHPALRSHGLGRGLLAEALRRFQSDGLPSARLAVDGENPSGAKRLYERLGFAPINSEILYGCAFLG
jgi:ribosomal protein S18 acetylase RimI-like enzyme